MSALLPAQFVRCFAGEALTLTVTMDPPESVAGWALEFSLRNGAGDLLASKTVGAGVTLTDGPGGEFTVTLAADDTDQAAGKSYPFDVWRTDEGSEACVVFGALLVQARVRP
jgi:hypothetical protein